MKHLHKGYAWKGFLGLLLLTLAAFFNGKAQAQQSEYWNTIKNYRKQDSLKRPPSAAILFLGSSSFTNWHATDEAFPTRTVLNRGFGGSRLGDIIAYVRYVKYPPKLKQIVIYAGDNDIAYGLNAQQTFTLFKDLYGEIRKTMPELPIAYVSIKGCPGRIGSLPVVKEANALVKEFLSTESNVAYIDIFSATMLSENKPMEDIYVEDGVHMNPKGYAIWTKVFTPYLK